MKHKLCLQALRALAFAGAFYVALPEAEAAAPAGFVHRSSQRIVDGSNQVIKLRGPNLGGILLWEGWLFGMASDLVLNGSRLAESYIISRLAQKTSVAEAHYWREQVYRSGIREQDFARIAQLGYNAVRLPFNHVVLEDDVNPFVYKDSGWALLDDIVSWAETYGVYIVLDLHAAPGGQSPYFIADPDGRRATLWDNTTNNKQRTVALWRAIASRYAGRTIIAAYDLLNEPAPPSGADLVSLHQQIISAIRQVDTNHLVLVEGSSFATDFSMFSEPLDGNQGYSFHQYTWANEDRQAQLNGYVSVARAHDLPLWNGEFGVNTHAIVDSTVALYEDPTNGIDGQAFWLWKRSPGALNFPALRTAAKPPSWQPVLDWLDQVWGANPSPAQVRQGMLDYLTALRLENTTEDPALIAALQPNGRPAGGPAWRGPTATVTGGWWTNGFEVSPGGAFTDGGSAAANLNNVGDSQNYYDFNFSVPPGAIIDGIEVRVDHRAEATLGAPALAIALSNDGGWTWTGNRSVPIASTTERTDVVGWSRDLWGKSWSSSSFSNANFRVGVSATCVTTSACSGVRDFYLDYVAARVFYH